MAVNYMKELQSLFTVEAFKALVNQDVIKIGQLHTIIDILIKAAIPFDITFSPGTKRVAPAIRVTIFINPTTTVSFVLNLESGGSIFGGGLT